MRQYRVKYLDNSSKVNSVTVTAPSMAAVENYFGIDKVLSIALPKTKSGLVISGYGEE